MQSEDLLPEIKFENAVHVHSADSEPWMTEHTRSIVNPIVRFHNEIIDFANYIQPCQQQHQQKTSIATQFQQQLSKSLSNTTILTPFLKNKLYLKKTELQIFVIVQNQQQNWQQECLSAIQTISPTLCLKIYNLSAQSSEQECRVIAEHWPSQVQVWVRFLPASWKLFITEMDECINSSAELRYLYYIFYCMLRQRSFHIYIRSLFIYGICSFFVYERRKQRVRTLTENVIKFLEFFAIGMSQDKERKITYKEGNVYTYIMSSDKVFSFQISENVDIAASRKTRDFFKVLQNRYRVLGNFYYPPGSSILAHLVNPCFGKFFY